MSLSAKIKVAVLRGGSPISYETSLKTGGHVLSLLREMPDKYELLDIFISKEGEWHREGLVEEPYRALRHADVVWNALGGVHELDRQAMKLIEYLKIPFTGSTAIVSALSSNLDTARNIFRLHAIDAPTHKILTRENFNEAELITIFRNYLHPVTIKNLDSNNLMLTHKAWSFNELREKVRDVFKYSPRVLVEEYLPGREVHCFVIEDVAHANSHVFISATFPDRSLGAESHEVEKVASSAHRALNLRHYSVFRLIITPRGKIFVSDTHPLPPFHGESLTTRLLKGAGWQERRFIEHILELALRG